MRRGLMGWNPDELPLATLHERLARLRATMRRAGFDAFLIYTNMVRPAAVTYLTGFTPYWSDGILLVLESGPPILATALSKRVAPWMRTTTPVSEIVSAPKPGTAIGERLAAAPAVKRVGVLELGEFPSGHYDDLLGAAPAVELVDGSVQYSSSRRAVDDAERALLVRADALAIAALNNFDVSEAEDAGRVSGLVEHDARLNGAEEVYVAVASDLNADRRLIRISRPVPLARSFAVRVSVAYKGAWSRRIRSFAKEESGRRIVARADTRFAEIVRRIEPQRPLSTQLTAQLDRLPGGVLVHWMAESSIGSYPLQTIAASRTPCKDAPAPGSYLVLTMELAINGIHWLGAAPLFVGDH